MRICVFGAGSVGGYLAGSLARGSADVSVVARGAHLAAIRGGGLTVETPDATINARLPASDDPADLGPQDAVIVTVKAPSLPAVAATIGPLLGDLATGRTPSFPIDTFGIARFAPDGPTVPAALDVSGGRGLR